MSTPTDTNGREIAPWAVSEELLRARSHWLGQMMLAGGPKPTSRLVATALAQHLNAAGEAWPSAATLALETGLSTRSCADHLTELAEHGWLRLVRPGGVRGSTLTNRWAAVTPAGRSDVAWPTPEHVAPTPEPPAGVIVNPAATGSGVTPPTPEPPSSTPEPPAGVAPNRPPTPETASPEAVAREAAAAAARVDQAHAIVLDRRDLDAESRRKGSPAGYVHRTTELIRRDLADLAISHPDWTADQLADAKHPPPAGARTAPTVPDADHSDCASCDGHGWIHQHDPDDPAAPDSVLRCDGPHPRKEHPAA